MTEARERFFTELMETAAARGRLKLSMLEFDGVRVAACISFDYEDSYLLYNSGYDPAYSQLSVGFVNKAWTIKDAIESGKRTFDFLRGIERYKYDLGAEDPVDLHHSDSQVSRTGYRCATSPCSPCTAALPGVPAPGTWAGMNVYVTHVARELAKFGCRVDIYTRSDHAHGREIVNITPFVRVIHVDAGPVDESKHALSGHVPTFVEAVDGFRREHRLTYELVHSHYWLSGMAGNRAFDDLARSARHHVSHDRLDQAVGTDRRAGAGGPRRGGARGHGRRERDCRLDRAGTVGYLSPLQFGAGEDQRPAGRRGPGPVSTGGQGGGPALTRPA